MKAVLIVSVIITEIICASIPEDAQATIIKYENTNDGKGNYKFSFETSNGILRREIGILVNAGESDEHIEINGMTSYREPDGHLVIIHYTAGKNGYRVETQPTVDTDPFIHPMVAYGLPGNVVATLLGK